MIARIPGALPATYDPSGYYYNPTGGMPAPFPQGMPSPGWLGSSSWLNFSTSGLPAGIYARAVWSSPLFSLRPYFRGLLNNAVNGDTQAQGAVDIWLPNGAGGKLWVQTGGLTALPWGTSGLRVLADELAHPFDASRLALITREEDITTEYVGGAAAALGTFVPPGGGYPVAYYQVRLTFDYLIDHSAEAGWPGPRFVVEAAYY